MAKTQVSTVVAADGKTIALVRKDGTTPLVDAAQVALNPNAALPPTGNAEFVSKK